MTTGDGEAMRGHRPGPAGPHPRPQRALLPKVAGASGSRPAGADPQSLLITGASSGIGAALARAYAAPGRVLFLTGRDRARLDAVAEACRALGARVETALLDVTDAAATAAFLRAADAAYPLDLVIANAGIAEGVSEPATDLEAARRLIEVNLFGSLNTLAPAIAAMAGRGRGQVVLMSSIAALRGLPGSHGYSASKAALKALAEGLRAPLAARGVAVNLVLPGFVRTPMNEGRGFPTPLRIEPDRAAAIIRRGLAANRAVIAFPRLTWWAARALALWPRLADALAMRVARHGAPPSPPGS
ncbi:SDR family NAD(P)-dependent oxidoreductase [Crenalkalicoccus roseus]|uniref:SDR family NAD(P)-dependent oxidoreductase n=1 Tax=Crenalkalicoccus roseus TaxID=1485588 RepID=UPI001F0081F8|nr:SDR family NAD(P)-dependent oxidoreductase [Crenalkalicoccus roseus]